MIIIVKRENLIQSAIGKPINEITLRDLQGNIRPERANIVAFVEDGFENRLFNYKELRNRYDDCYTAYNISQERIGDYLAELCTSK